jgi:hypothetical protein
VPQAINGKLRIYGRLACYLRYLWPDRKGGKLKGPDQKRKLFEAVNLTNNNFRRGIMLAKRIALICILAAAIFIVGCSDKKSATAPSLSSTEQPTVATPLDRPDPNTDGVDININKRVMFTGGMHKSEDNGGCWYIRSTSGLLYVPIFAKEPDFYEGLYLKVNGYILDEVADCIKCPLVQVMDYEVVRNAADEGRQSTLVGTLQRMPDGEQCSYIEVTIDKTVVELNFPQYLLRDELKYENQIEVTGYINEDLTSHCVDGLVMNVLKFHYIDGSFPSM